MSEPDTGGFGFSYSNKFINTLSQRLEQVAQSDPKYKSPVVTLTPVSSTGEALGESIPVHVIGNDVSFAVPSGKAPDAIPSSTKTQPSTTKHVINPSKKEQNAPKVVAEPPRAHRPVFREQPAHTSEVQKAYQYGAAVTAVEFQGKLKEAHNQISQLESAISGAALAALEIKPEIPQEDQERIDQLFNLIDVLDKSAVAPRQVFGATCDKERQNALLCFKHAQSRNQGTPDTLPCSKVLDNFVRCAEKIQATLRMPIPKKPEPEPRVEVEASI